jgi:AraC-like DNA-binding protein
MNIETNNIKESKKIKTIEITKSKLKSLYNNFTMKEIQKELGISHPTLLKYLRKFGIAKVGSGNRTNHKRAIVLISERTIADPLKQIKEEPKNNEKKEEI